MKISFVSADSRREIQNTVDFLAAQSLGYPRYQDWVGRAESELHSRYKRAIMAFFDDRLVADLLWQPHKSLAGLLEIKNIRVHPAVRLRDFGRFMLKQAELTPGFLGSICDVREDQPRIVQFMVRCGYSVAATVPLYDSENNDIVLVKFFGDERVPIQLEAA